MIRIDIPHKIFSIYETSSRSCLGNRITKPIFEKYMEEQFGADTATVINSKDDGTIFILVHNNKLYQFKYMYSTFNTFSIKCIFRLLYSFHEKFIKLLKEYIL